MHLIKTIAFLLLIGYLLLQSCNVKRDSLIDEMILTEKVGKQSDSAHTDIELMALVWNIANSGSVKSEYISFDGRKSNQPDYSLMLTAVADTNQLLKLTNHGSGLVKYFAFQALQRSGYKSLRKVFLDHLSDKQTYLSYGGCIQTNVPINVTYLYFMSSSLTLSEFEYYKNEIRKINGNLNSLSFGL